MFEREAMRLIEAGQFCVMIYDDARSGRPVAVCTAANSHHAHMTVQ
jgi:hypothetical protein